MTESFNPQFVSPDADQAGSAGPASTESSAVEAGAAGAETVTGQAGEAIVVNRPAAGESVGIQAVAGQTYVLDFPPGDAQVLVQGDNLILGFDDKAVYVEQRFVRPGSDGEPEVYAKGYIRGRFLKQGGGTVSVAELIEAIGEVPEEMVVPERLLEWGQGVSLPATRAAAPSIWT